MDGLIERHDTLPLNENITGTLDASLSPVENFSGQYNYRENSVAAAARCGYVVSAEWRYGAAGFCDAPARAGSSYCARHGALCLVSPRSRAGRAIAAEQARAGDAAPFPRRTRDRDKVPGPLIATEPEEVLGALDLPARDADPS